MAFGHAFRIVGNGMLPVIIHVIVVITGVHGSGIFLRGALVRHQAVEEVPGSGDGVLVVNNGVLLNHGNLGRVVLWIRVGVIEGEGVLLTAAAWWHDKVVCFRLGFGDSEAV